VAVVIRKSVRIAAQDRVHEAIEASRANVKLPTHGTDADREGRKARWAVFHERLHAVIAEAMHSPKAFSQVLAAVSALARYDADMAKQLHDAVPNEGKQGRRPRRAWLDEEIVGLYEFSVQCAVGRGERYPAAVARREVADLFGLGEEAVRSIVRRAGSVK